MTTSLSIFGREGSKLYVNSAQGISRDAVLAIFPEADLDGSVLMIDVCQTIQEQSGEVCRGEMMAGKVAIRRFIQDWGGIYRDMPYTKRQANRLIQKFSFIGEIEGGDGYRIPWTQVDSLGCALRAYDCNAANTHRKALESARRKLRSSHKETSVVTDCSSRHMISRK